MTPPPPTPSGYGSAVAYEEALTAHGWSYLGGGVAGRVYHREQDTEVVKVVDGDLCYRSFVDFVLAGPLPCLPVLQLIHWDEDELWGVVHIERLGAATAAAAALVDAWWTAYCAYRRDGTAAPEPAAWTTMLDALSAHLPAGSECRFDIKAENVMLRGVEVVFTDPLN